MSTNLDAYPDFAPSFSADRHFLQVAGFKEVRFDPEKCAQLFMHPAIGIDEADLPRIHIHMRPDYDIGYKSKERKQIRADDRKEYDSEHAACETVEEDDNPRFGEIGDVLITLVYGSGYGVNKLLCHEAIHAREMLKKHGLFVGIARGIASPLIGLSEEREADRAMTNPELKKLRKGVIKVKR